MFLLKERHPKLGQEELFDHQQGLRIINWNFCVNYNVFHTACNYIKILVKPRLFDLFVDVHTCINKCSKYGWTASTIFQLEEHRRDIHGLKLKCPFCFVFLFPESFWRLFRQHCHEVQPD